jgi:hypothetical protein
MLGGQEPVLREDAVVPTGRGFVRCAAFPKVSEEPERLTATAVWHTDC